MLRALGVEPDGMVGHSVGELGCAYADGCFTAREMILSAYARGLASQETELIAGMMAAVGLSHQDIKCRLPESVEVACHNAADSCTISGPAKLVTEFVTQLKAEGIFARTVNVANIAYHSTFIAPAGPRLLTYLKEVISIPKQRSNRWLSSSVPESDWDSPIAATSSPEYHTNNLLSPVLFEEAVAHIPSNAIIIEIAPHGLLQAILKRSHSSCLNIALTSRTSSCPIRLLLKAIGTLHLNNVDMNVTAIYPHIEFPVSRGTPPLSPLISWDYSESWSYGHKGRGSTTAGEKIVAINIHMDDYRQLTGHQINNKVILPVSALLMFAWKMLLKIKVAELDTTPIIFKNVVVHDNIEVPELTSITLSILVQRGSGHFELSLLNTDCRASTISINGEVCMPEDPDSTYVSSDAFMDSNNHMVHNDCERLTLSQTEIYDLLRSTGYKLSKEFTNIEELKVSDNDCEGTVVWNQNWMTFLDSLFKVCLFMNIREDQSLLLPAKFDRLVIDPSKFLSLPIGTKCPFSFESQVDVLHCNGVELFGLKVSSAAGSLLSNPSAQSRLGLERVQFVPNTEPGLKDFCSFVSVCIQLMSENCSMRKSRHIVAYELQNGVSSAPALQEIIGTLKDKINFDIEIHIVPLSSAKSISLTSTHCSYLVAVGGNMMQEVASLLQADTNAFLLARFAETAKVPAVKQLVTVLEQKIGTEKCLLYRKVAEFANGTVVGPVGDCTASWLSSLRQEVALAPPTGPLVLYWDKQPNNIEHVLDALYNEPQSRRFRCVFILDEIAPPFSLTSDFYREQLTKGLVVNILKDGIWGTNRRLPVNLVGLNQARIIKFKTNSLKNVEVHYISLNQADSNVLLDGKKKCKVSHLEYSGTTKQGARVMGLATFHASDNRIEPDCQLTWSIPETWTLEEAATIPLAFTQAYYALSLRGPLAQCGSILIIAGYTPLLQAIVRISLHEGFSVFTAVQTKGQASTLMKRFPSLAESQILLCSDGLDLRLEVPLMLATNGRGVDLVINTVGSRVLQSAFRCLAPSGTFVHCGLTEHDRNNQLGMLKFLRCTSLYCFSEDTLFGLTGHRKRELRAAVQAGIDAGHIRPFDRKVFQTKQIGAGLKYLKEYADKKVLLSMKPEGKPNLSLQDNALMNVQYSPDKSYIIVGGRHGLWLDLAEWLLVRGARRLVVALERHMMGGAVAQRFNSMLTRYHATMLLVAANNADTVADAQQLIRQATQLGPLDAVFMLFMSDCSVKVGHLDTASRKLCPSLRQFVCLLGGDASVCELRQAACSGLSLTIKCDKPLNRPSIVLQYLEKLLFSTSHSHLVLINTWQHYRKQGIMEGLDMARNFLPRTARELVALGSGLPLEAGFTAVASLCPLLEHVREVLPVFVVPGLNPCALAPLLRHIMYPVYTAALPMIVDSVEGMAAALIQSLLAVQTEGPYTLVGEGWGGSVALELQRLLEGQGHSVRLVLLEGAPECVLRWATAIGDAASPVFHDNLLTIVLSLTPEQMKTVAASMSWDKKVEAALFEQPEELKPQIVMALETICCKLATLYDFKPSSPLLKGSCVLVRLGDASDVDRCCLYDFFERSVSVEVMEETDYIKMLCSPKTAAVINNSALHKW